MGTTLDHGIYLPDEGERNCYDGLAGNWVALDNHLGSTNIHVTINDKQAWNGHVADSVKHVTAEDKAKWNGKADASALTAHTGDTTIHVTAEDKNKWDAVTSKADDSAVVHKSGDESVIGSKRFGVIQNFTGFPSIRLYSTDDDITVLPSSAQQRDIRFTDKNNAIIAYFIFQHRNNADEPFRTCWRQNRLDGTTNYYSVDFNNLGEFYPENNNAIVLGRSSNKWSDVQTYKVNALEPSSLSLPDIDNRIDISSYITNLSGGGNVYTPTVNGWICIRSANANKISILDSVTTIGNALISNKATYLTIMTPAVANRKVIINVMCTSLEHAYFVPCQGNI